MRDLCAMFIAGVSPGRLLELFADDAMVTGTGAAPCPCSGKEEIGRAIQQNYDLVIAVGLAAIIPERVTRTPMRPGSLFWRTGTCAGFDGELRIVGDRIASLRVDHELDAEPACSQHAALPQTGTGGGGRSLPTALPFTLLLLGGISLATGVGRASRPTRPGR